MRVSVVRSVRSSGSIVDKVLLSGVIRTVSASRVFARSRIFSLVKSPRTYFISNSLCLKMILFISSSESSLISTIFKLSVLLSDSKDSNRDSEYSFQPQMII